MTRWGYEPAVKNFVRRDADGSAEVLFVRGDQPLASGRYEKPGFHMEAIDKAVKQHKIPRHRHVWWIFVYVADPPRRFSDWRGSGNLADGGWALVNYDSSPGEIDPKADLSAGFNDTFALKGCIHELGHAFGLPHIGPSPGKGLGNSLMGPNMDVYIKQGFPDQGRVYLTPASAALLWKHPLFSGTARDRSILPEVRLEGYRASFDRKARQVVVTGKLSSNVPAHSVVVLDDMDQKPGPYWVRGYAGRVSDDGTFRVTIDEPVASGGALSIVFCFRNGAVTGDGKGYNLESAIVKPYRLVRGALRFDP